MLTSSSPVDSFEPFSTAIEKFPVPPYWAVTSPAVAPTGRVTRLSPAPVAVTGSKLPYVSSAHRSTAAVSGTDSAAGSSTAGCSAVGSSAAASVPASDAAGASCAAVFEATPAMAAEIAIESTMAAPVTIQAILRC